MKVLVTLLAAALVASLASCAGGARAAPILRIINMLTMMGSKVEQEAKSQEELFDKAMCNCKESKAAVKDLIEKAQVASQELKSSISETSASKAELTQEIAGHNSDFAAASKILQEQLSMRNKEKSEFQTQKTESEANIAALGRAAKALQEGLPQEDFLQTRAASVIQGLLLTGKPYQSDDREALTAFLQQQSADAYTPADSREIIGIILQLKEDMEKELKAMEKTEIERQSAYEALTQAKEKEKLTNEEAAKTKNERLSDELIKLADMQQDFEDTNENLELNTKSLADLNEDCAKRDHDFAVLKKELRAESIALAETVEILSGESAQENFKSMLPTATFLQVALGNVQHHVQSSKRNEAEIESFATSRQKRSTQKRATPGIRRGIDSILALIDRMIQLLAKEQQEDASKKDFCKAELQKNEDLKAELEQAVKDISAAIDSTEDDLSQVEHDISEKKEEIVMLDEAVRKATSLRKEEHAEHVKVLADNYAANDILEVAKKKLKAFYEKPAAEQAALLQAREGDTALDQTYEDDSRATSSSADKRSSHRKPLTAEGLKVIEMLEDVQKELKAEGEQAKQDEKDAQAEYERLLEDSKKQRDEAVKAITNKEETRAGHQESLKVNKDKKNAKSKELQETKDILASLIEDCSNMQYFDIRTAGREAEVNKLQSAKAHLSGLASPVSLAQARTFRGARHRTREVVS
mmetsp:Transcript_81638/g.141911  ORF Transcript_81638/g.141911 Transcript_81638/m.141911 type:complete len:701 (+) Transcript_81638:155-2257(+)